MVVGKRYDEATVLRVAEAFEQSGDWHNMQRFRPF
jgi:Asp-tRNA(Asn)/Glu-tRNA(Gln) amidotransferase A subunit family amidase